MQFSSKSAKGTASQQQLYDEPALILFRQFCAAASSESAADVCTRSTSVTVTLSAASCGCHGPPPQPADGAEISEGVAAAAPGSGTDLATAL